MAFRIPSTIQKTLFAIAGRIINDAIFRRPGKSSPPRRVVTPSRSRDTETRKK